MELRKCIRCGKDQEKNNNIMGQPVCEEHSNFSPENGQAIFKILYPENNQIIDKLSTN